jgi:hypothetical protein
MRPSLLSPFNSSGSPLVPSGGAFAHAKGQSRLSPEPIGLFGFGR